MFITKYNKIIFFSLIFVLSFLIVAQAGLALDPRTMDGLNTTAQGGFGEDITKSETDLPTLIGRIVGVGLSLLGVVFFVIIVYAGISWIMAMGKEEKINQAKEMIIGAILGLIVVLAAYAITHLVGGIFTSPK
ncbi:hypothetical protein HY797_04365 [Candidatus Falkowbacteria bacterium]|nr:hypothetical protein [Candidatus Falkowbacteria bacterium]